MALYRALSGITLFEISKSASPIVGTAPCGCPFRNAQNPGRTATGGCPFRNAQNPGRTATGGCPFGNAQNPGRTATGGCPFRNAQNPGRTATGGCPFGNAQNPGQTATGGCPYNRLIARQFFARNNAILPDAEYNSVLKKSGSRFGEGFLWELYRAHYPFA